MFSRRCVVYGFNETEVGESLSNMALARHKAASKLEIKVALDIMCQCQLSIVGDTAYIHFWRLSTFSTVGD